MKKNCLVGHYNNNARCAWEERPYPVVTHCDWSVKSRDSKLRRQTLKHHPDYWTAKNHGDYVAAQEVVDDLLNEEALISLEGILGKERPIVVAPSLTKDDPKNVIPIWFAHNIAYQMGLQVCQDIYQDDRAHRTGRSGFYRIANQASFHGKVVEGQTYLIVDDVLTLGGTAASLRNFIEANGGKVLAFCVLAHSDPERARTRQIGPQVYDLRITNESLENLRKKHGQELEEFMQRNCGYGFNALTRHEAAFLGFFERTSDVRSGILAEKDCRSPQCSPRVS